MAQNINDIIKEKEKELQQYQHLRISELENLIEERNNIILEYTNKFNLLKDDFLFNLKLIEARDEEIKKLEDIIKTDKAKYQELSNQYAKLQYSNDEQEQSIRQLETRIEEEKTKHKSQMLEIRNIIQEIQVSASQEIQAQQARISSLQTEIQQSQQQKKDLLLAQREELTQHYDMLLQQREEIHSTRDHDIVQKIQLLDNRFETLTLENTKVKALYREKKLQYEQLHEQIIQKDEKIKKLTYDLEDTQSNFMTKEDQYNRRISQLENDREHWLEEKSLFMKDYEMKLEQSRQENQRERDVRSIIEQRFQAFQEQSSTQYASLQQQYNTIQQQHTQLQASYEEIEDDLHHWKEKYMILHTENVSLLQENTKKKEQLNKKEDTEVTVVRELTQVKTQNDQLQTRINTLKEEKLAIIRQYETKFKSLGDLSAEKIRKEQVKAQQILETKEQQLEEQIKSYKLLLHKQEDHELDMMNKAEGITKKLKEEITQWKTQYETLQEQEKQTKVEKEAIALRCSVYEQQVLALQKEIKQAKQVQFQGQGQSGNNNNRSYGGQQQGTSMGLPPRPLTISTTPMILGNTNNGPNTNQSITDMSLSELLDLPPLTSPLQMSAEEFHSPWNHHDEDLVRESTGSAFPSTMNNHNNNNNNNHQNAFDPQQIRLLQENEQLKQIIRTMRQDIEQLQHQSVTPIRPADDQQSKPPQQQSTTTPAKITQPPIMTTTISTKETKSSQSQSKPLEDLELALQKSKEEINKLTLERKRLMDTCTELRHNVITLQEEQSLQNASLVQEKQDETLNTIFDWMAPASTASPLPFFKHREYTLTNTATATATANQQHHTNQYYNNYQDHTNYHNTMTSTLPPPPPSPPSQIPRYTTNTFDNTPNTAAMNTSEKIRRRASTATTSDSALLPSSHSLAVTGEPTIHTNPPTAGIPAPKKVSSRGTPSQQQALQRLKDHQLLKIQGSGGGQQGQATVTRKVMNYARYREEEELERQREPQPQSVMY